MSLNLVVHPDHAEITGLSERYYCAKTYEAYKYALVMQRLNFDVSLMVRGNKTSDFEKKYFPITLKSGSLGFFDNYQEPYLISRHEDILQGFVQDAKKIVISGSFFGGCTLALALQVFSLKFGYDLSDLESNLGVYERQGLFVNSDISYGWVLQQPTPIFPLSPSLISDKRPFGDVNFQLMNKQTKVFYPSMFI